MSKGSKCSMLSVKSHVGIGSRWQVALEHDLMTFINNSDGVTKSNVSNKVIPSFTLLSSNLLLGIEWYESISILYSNLFNFVHKERRKLGAK